MPNDSRLSIEELRAVEAQIAAQPGQEIVFLKEGVLAVIRAAIAAEIALKRRRSDCS